MEILFVPKKTLEAEKIKGGNEGALPGNGDSEGCLQPLNPDAAQYLWDLSGSRVDNIPGPFWFCKRRSRYVAYVGLTLTAMLLNHSPECCAWVPLRPHKLKQNALSKVTFN